MPTCISTNSRLTKFKKSTILTAILFALAQSSTAFAFSASVPSNALPTNGTVIDGVASDVITGNTMTITTGNSGPGHNTIILWGNQGGASLNAGASGGFNVGSQATLIFKATDVQSDVLNVDISGNPSVLAGHLTINSNNVFIANGNGIFVGPQADINISGLNQTGNGELGLIADGLGSSATNLRTYADSIENLVDGNSSAGALPLGSGSVTISPGAFIGNNSSNDDPEVLIAGSDVNVGGSINAYSYGIALTSLNNTINIGSTGSLGATAGNVNIAPAVTDGSNQQQIVSIEDNGIMGDQSTMKIGGNGLNVQDITGSGSLAVGGLTINNLTGSINNITSGQILANGFQVNMAPGYNQIVINAVGDQPQGINLRINGSALISTGNTVAVLPNGQAPANENSKLVVQASGNLTIENHGANGVNNPDPYNPADNSFQFPGLIYLQSDQTLRDFDNDIVNAYTTDAPVGYGVFLIAPNIKVTNPVYANGGRGVVFAAPFNGIYYPYASINNDGPNAGMPPVYFLSNSGPVQTGAFTNAGGNSQENNTFYTFVPGN